MVRLPHVFLVGFIMIAAALYFAGSSPVIGQTNNPTRGPYTIAPGDNNFVWRIDQATGLVSYCYRGTNSLDRALIQDRPPYCSGWGN